MKNRRFDTTIELSRKARGKDIFESKESSCVQCREIFEQMGRVRVALKDLGGGYEILQKIHQMESKSPLQYIFSIKEYVFNFAL